MEFKDFIMENEIKGFQGENRWLSNFWPAMVTLDGISYPTTEQAYVAAKTLDPEIRKQIAALTTPGKAKRFGRRIEVRPDWENVKLAVMEDLTRQKFNIPELKEKLLATGDAYIEETNRWGDKFWGVSGGVGQNNLGKIIMKVRDELR